MVVHAFWFGRVGDNPSPNEPRCIVLLRLNRPQEGRDDDDEAAEGEEEREGDEDEEDLSAFRKKVTACST